MSITQILAVAATYSLLWQIQCAVYRF